MIGERFSRLVVVNDPIGVGVTRKVTCRCDCGVEKSVCLRDMQRGKTRSCGCMQRERARSANVTHGEGARGRRSGSYASWASMIQRCTNPKNENWRYYGGRGIRVCDRWLGSFEAFLADVGDRPIDTTLDRYPDVNGNYEPGNVRWATVTEQSRNRRPWGTARKRTV